MLVNMPIEAYGRQSEADMAPHTGPTGPKSRQPKGAPKPTASKSIGQSVPRSPLAPKTFANPPPLAGVRLATGQAGITYRDRTDVLLAVLAPGTQVAGVFTKSKTASAPVEWCRRLAASGTARALVVNAGNANAFTGSAGVKSVKNVAAAAAAAVGGRAAEIFIASTGTIGEPLPDGKITKILARLAKTGAEGGWRAAAEAIMTTDTYPKLASATARIDGRKVTITGIAKGSGMIAPDMATVLAFVFTDARLPAAVLQSLLTDGVEHSFNSITVDSDTSTSDTVLLFATAKGGAHASIAKAKAKRLASFKKALDSVLLDLALQIVRDGEGASKLIRIEVTGAQNDAAAKRIALSIANSPLVKTAMAGGDANWGRIVMAVGKAGEKAHRDRLRIALGHHVVAEKGARAPGYNEKRATKAVAGKDVAISVDVGVAKGKARVWTCDLTEGYIRINASYRT